MPTRPWRPFALPSLALLLTLGCATPGPPAAEVAGGQLQMEAPGEGFTWALVQADADTIYGVGDAGGQWRVVALDALSGEPRWRAALDKAEPAGEARLRLTPFRGRTLLSIHRSEGPSTLLALDGGGEVAWRLEHEGYARPLGVRGADAFVLAAPHTLERVDLTTGARRWTRAFPDHDSLHGGWLAPDGRSIVAALPGASAEADARLYLIVDREDPDTHEVARLTREQLLARGLRGTSDVTLATARTGDGGLVTTATLDGQAEPLWRHAHPAADGPFSVGELMLFQRPASGGQGPLRVEARDLRSFEPRWTLERPEGVVTAAARRCGGVALSVERGGRRSVLHVGPGGEVAQTLRAAPGAQRTSYHQGVLAWAGVESGRAYLRFARMEACGGPTGP